MASTALKQLEPQDLLEAVRIDPKIMVDLKANKGAGLAYLNHAEQQATLHYLRSQEHYTKCILWLHIIREHELWTFGGFKNWSQYIENWIATGAKGRTMVLDSLKAVRLWTGPTINRLPAELTQYEEGISSIEPLFDPKNGMVEDYNNRTGEIEKLRDEWEVKLPGNTMGEKIGSFIDELPKDTTKVNTRDLVRDEIPEEKIELYPWWKDGKVVGIVFKMYTKDGELFAEGSDAAPNLFAKAYSLGVIGKLMAHLKFPMEWRNG